jgi:hypothetical protein
MPMIENLIRTNLQNFGIEPFGITMPVISKQWIAGGGADVTGRITLDEAGLFLDSSSENWLAPLGGQVRRVDTSPSFKAPVTLFKTDGSAVNEQGLLLTLFPQAYLRLSRLYANLLETDTTFNPLRARGLAIRPVPKYFFFSGTVPSSFEGGEVQPKDDLGIQGTLRVFDENGWIIDPLAVSSVLSLILSTHPILDIASGDPDQMSSISSLRSGPSFRVHLVKPNGDPYDGTHMMGNLSTTGGDSSRGLFSVNAFTGADTTVLREIVRDAGTGSSGSFPDSEALFLLIGLSTYGRLSNRVRIPQLPSGTTIDHDFFTLRVVELHPYLAGSPSPTFAGTKLEPKPKVRINEVMDLLADGNRLMGRISEILTGTPDEQLLVAETIDSDFPLPPDATDVFWNDFPALPATLPDGTTPLVVETDAFPTNIKEQVTAHSTARLIDSGGVHHVDVLLTLIGVPLGSAVRTYNRRLGTDFVEERGDGAGGVVVDQAPPADGRTFDGTIQLVLMDPLGLRRPDGTFTAPVHPKLNFDLVINRQDKSKRVLGNIELSIDITPVPAPAEAIDNGLRSVARRGIAHAGIHGLPSASVSLGASPSIQDMINASLEVLGETHPLGRDAPRLPWMARRDLLVASRTGINWKAALSGGRASRQMHSADSRAGCPGSRGGRETQYSGFYTQHGRLAYDIARAAFRRTDSAYTRIPALVGSEWDEPAAPTALAPGAPQSADAGPFAGALLANIAPHSETPELALLKSIVESQIDTFPATFDDLVDWLTSRVNAIPTTSLPTVLSNAVGRLKTELINWLNAQKDGDTLSESQKERIFDELKREISAACFGRRDSLWALESGIQNARQFIYIETPAFGPTRYGTGGAEYSRNLLSLIQAQIDQHPGLHVMICVPKMPEYAPNYNELARREVSERQKIFITTPTSTAVLNEKRVVVFHPLGFPGRPSLLEHQVVIVDDQWMLLGSSTFRRRGFAFDGSTDLVMTGYDSERGVSSVIRDFRKRLLRTRLALGASNKTSLENPNAARLDDGREAFYVIREMLRAGGYGLIERLWDGREPHVAFTEPSLSEDLWNPEGLEYNAGLAAFIAFLISTGHPGTTFHDV